MVNELRKPLLIVVLALVFSALGAITVEYEIKSLGLKIANLSIKHDLEQRQITILAKSHFTSKIFPRLDNEYTVSYNENYLPQNYLRKINQDSNQDVVSVTYHHSQKQAQMRMASKDSPETFRITPDTRDFFTMITMVGQLLPQTGRYTIDGNGKLWKASLVKNGTERIKTARGTFQAHHYCMTMAPLDDSKAPYIDMVSHNVFNEATQINFWVSEERTVVKAVVKKGLISMNWDLVDFRP